MKINVWAIIAFVIGTLLGSGSIWQWQQAKVNNISKTVEWRKELDPTYRRIIELDDEFIRLQNQLPRVPMGQAHTITKEEGIVYRKIESIRLEMKISIDNFNSLQNKIANLENSNPVHIIKDYTFWPSTPQDLIVK